MTSAILEDRSFGRAQPSKEWPHTGDCRRDYGPVQLRLSPTDKSCKV
jgi:hypothetical protein